MDVALQRIQRNGYRLVAVVVVLAVQERSVAGQERMFGAEACGSAAQEPVFLRFISIDIAQAVEVRHEIEKAVARGAQVADHPRLRRDDAVPGSVIAEQAHSLGRDDGGVEIFPELGDACDLPFLRRGDAAEQLPVTVELHDVRSAFGLVFGSQDRGTVSRRNRIQVARMARKGFEAVRIGVVTADDRPAAMLPARVGHDFGEDKGVVAVGHQGTRRIGKRPAEAPVSERVDADDAPLELHPGHRGESLVAQRDRIGDFGIDGIAAPEQRGVRRVRRAELVFPLPQFGVAGDGSAPVLADRHAGSMAIGPVRHAEDAPELLHLGLHDVAGSEIIAGIIAERAGNQIAERILARRVLAE